MNVGVFSLWLPRVCKIKHFQPAFINICQILDHSKERSKSECATGISASFGEISFLLDIPCSAVKKKSLSIKAAQTPGGWPPNKVTERWGMTVSNVLQCSAESQTFSTINISTKPVHRELHDTGFYAQASPLFEVYRWLQYCCPYSAYEQTRNSTNFLYWGKRLELKSAL